MTHAMRAGEQAAPSFILPLSRGIAAISNAAERAFAGSNILLPALGSGNCLVHFNLTGVMA